MREEVQLPGDGAAIERIDARNDPDGAVFTLTAAGTTRMNWAPSPGGASRRFRFDDTTIDWQHDFQRLVTADRAVPVALNWPVSLAQTETIILPDGGDGYTLDGRSFERVAAGTRIGRQLTLSGDRAVARSVFVRLEREIRPLRPGGHSGADRDQRRRSLSSRPGGTLTAARTPATPPSGRSAQTDALLRTGYDLMNTGRTREALANFDRAIALTPEVRPGPCQSRCCAHPSEPPRRGGTGAGDRHAHRCRRFCRSSGPRPCQPAPDREAEALGAFNRR